MKILLSILAILCTLQGIAQQRTKEDRREEQDERKAAAKDRVDISVFRRQILTITEFSDQRRQIAEWKAQGKGVVKIYAVVDSLTEYEGGKVLKGYIQLVASGSEANVYELTFDRALKRIILVRPTGEQLEFDEPEKPARKPAAKKKSGNEEEDGEADEADDEEKDTRPARRKTKEDDEE